MKKILLILSAVSLTATLWAQSPEKMSYQAVVRNDAGQLVTNTQIGMQISILQGTSEGTAVYSEVQTPTTNANGLVSVEIGTGTTSDVFSNIDWVNGPYFIKTEIAIEAPLTTYSISGTSQILSVPYALHAKTAEKTTETDPVFEASPASGIEAADIGNWDEAYSWGDHALKGYLTEEPPGTASGEMKYWDGDQWLAVAPGKTGEFLKFCYGVPTWGDCPGKATLTTADISYITHYSAISGGNITDAGYAEVTLRGIVWSTQENPCLENNEGFTEDGEGIGSFVSELDGLSPVTIYFVRAYATNNIGTNYGEQKSFISADDDSETPICDPPCANGGICVAPNACECIDGYYGPTCEEF